MAQEIGRILRPSVAQFQGKRILLLVPLVHGPGDDLPDGKAILDRYWTQATSQVFALELQLGLVRHVYHEGLVAGGLPALGELEEMGYPSVGLVRRKVESGAFLEATEDAERLVETLDLQRCLMLPLASEKVAQRLVEWFTQSLQQRYQHVARAVDATLKPGEVGLMLIGERHQVQFPPDVEVLYVAPPALDEFRRWVTEWVAQQQAEAAAAEAAEEGQTPQA
ncbi:MAG TPA: hypothetical protein VI855_03975 [Dehalococcoidia bacterium]|nr:hypothetical protein [Dehalococcoidia bacterium]